MAAHVLDDPIWGSLTGAHAGLALRRGRAACFLPEIGPLAGVAALDADALGDLAQLVAEGDVVALGTPEGGIDDARWQLVQRIELSQMVCEAPIAAPELEPTPLSADDVPDMLALVERTQPGPFGPRTRELGGYLGLRDGGRLVAMGGERMRLPGYTEVSAICTAPEARGRGYAETMVRALASRIQARGERPFLHVAIGSPSHDTAVALYSRLGFRERRRAALSVLLRTAVR